jgi:hypothetical protein
MCIEKECELLETLVKLLIPKCNNSINRDDQQLSYLEINRKFRDYPVREYTQVSGSAFHPIRMMI